MSIKRRKKSTQPKNMDGLSLLVAQSPLVTCPRGPGSDKRLAQKISFFEISYEEIEVITKTGRGLRKTKKITKVTREGPLIHEFKNGAILRFVEVQKLAGGKLQKFAVLALTMPTNRYKCFEVVGKIELAPETPPGNELRFKEGTPPKRKRIFSAPPRNRRPQKFGLQPA